MAYETEVIQANIVRASNGFIINLYHSDMEDGELPQIVIATSLEQALEIARENLKD